MSFLLYSQHFNTASASLTGSTPCPTGTQQGYRSACYSRAGFHVPLCIKELGLPFPPFNLSFFPILLALYYNGKHGLFNGKMHQGELHLLYTLLFSCAHTCEKGTFKSYFPGAIKKS